MDPVAQRVKELISSLGLTNKDFAEQIEVAPAIISHVLSGRNKPSLHLIQQITNVYTNVNPWYIMHGKGSLFNQEVSGKEIAFNQESKDTNSSLPAGARLLSPPSGAPINKPQHMQESQSTPEEDVDSQVGKDDERTQSTNVYTNVNRTSDKEIERIVIFYGDKSFEEYCP